MNVICPNCQKMLTVADQYAGQLMKCPLCNNTFTVPALAPSTPPGGPPPTYTAAPPVPPATYSLQRETASPNPNAGPDLDEPLTDHAHDEPQRAAPERAAPPAGYARTHSIRLRPEVLQWVAPAALALVFLLTFFPWVGMYPAGNRVFSQSAWGAAFNGYSQEPVWNRIMNFHPDQDENHRPGADGLMIFFLLVLLVAVLAGWLVMLWPFLEPALHLKPAHVVAELLPWRSAVIGVLGGLALVLLLLQLVSGFRLDHKVREIADARTRDDERVQALFGQQDLTAEEQQRIDLVRGDWLARFNVCNATAARLALLLLILAVIAAGITFWLERRGERPGPRADFSW